MFRKLFSQLIFILRRTAGLAENGWELDFNDSRGVFHLHKNCDDCHNGASILIPAGNGAEHVKFLHCGMIDTPGAQIKQSILTHGTAWKRTRTPGDDLRQIEAEGKAIFRQDEW